MPQIIPARRTPFADQMWKEISANVGEGGERLFNKGKTRKEATAEKLTQMKNDLEMKRENNKLDKQFKHEKDLLEKKQTFEKDLFQKKLNATNDEEIKKSKEKKAPLHSALGIVEEMRNIRKKGNLGVGTSWSPFASTQKDAAQYEQLGKSLISYASTIPVRNQMEFETLAEQLYDPTLTDAKAEGILNAMERIISGSLEDTDEEDIEKEPKPKKEKRPLTAFHI